MKNILKTLQQEADYNGEVDQIVKFVKSGEPTKIRKMKSESNSDKISSENMEKIFDEISCVK